MTLPIDVWGIERADGSLFGDGIPLLYLSKRGAADACSTDISPVPLRIVRRDEAAAEVVTCGVACVAYGIDGAVTLRCSLPRGHDGSHLLPDPDAAQPAPVTRAEFEALRECVGSLAGVVRGRECFGGSENAVFDACNKIIDRLAALRKEATDGN